jgi:hypothetical protein
MHLRKCYYLPAALLILLLVPALASAQDQVIGVYDEGQLSFDYQQWPWGSYAGTFSAEGAALDTLLWGNEQIETCGGSIEVITDTTLAWGYGAIYQDDDTVDIAALFIRGAGELVPGDYVVDLTTFMAGFIYFEGVSDFVIPEDQGDIAAWLAAIVADRKFVSAEGVIGVTQVDAGAFNGTFNGSALDPESMMIITVSDGLFSYTGSILTSVPVATSHLRAQNFPNPFNPSTRISFSLGTAQQATLNVYDSSGRLIETLLDGFTDAGSHQIDWQALGRDGRRLPAGTYLYRLMGEREHISGKMILVP